MILESSAESSAALSVFLSLSFSVAPNALGILVITSSRGSVSGIRSGMMMKALALLAVALLVVGSLAQTPCSVGGTPGNCLDKNNNGCASGTAASCCLSSPFPSLRSLSFASRSALP